MEPSIKIKKEKKDQENEEECYNNKNEMRMIGEMPQ